MVVGIVEEVGRIGRTAEADVVVLGRSVLDLVELVGAVGEGDMNLLVAVEMTDVTAVNVDVCVVALVLAGGRGAGTTALLLCRVDEAAAELLGGDAVTIGCIVVVAVELTAPGNR